MRGRFASRSEPSIAVLPFANMSADASNRHFSDGLADTLLHMLAQVRELRVAARTSSFQFRDTNNDVRTIATVRGVAALLEGSVHKAGNEIRATAQLVDADTGFHLWSGIYERPFDDIFEIQDEIVTRVVDALKVSLLWGMRSVCSDILGTVSTLTRLVCSTSTPSWPYSVSSWRRRGD